jgi:hypothetical protein
VNEKLTIFTDMDVDKRYGGQSKLGQRVVYLQSASSKTLQTMQRVSSNIQHSKHDNGKTLAPSASNDNFLMR